MSIVSQILALLSQTGSPRATLTRGMRGIQPDLPFPDLPSGRQLPDFVRLPGMEPQGFDTPTENLPQQLRFLLQQEQGAPIQGPSLGNRDFPLYRDELSPEIPEPDMRTLGRDARMAEHGLDLEKIARPESYGQPTDWNKINRLLAQAAEIKRQEAPPELMAGTPMPGEGLEPRSLDEALPTQIRELILGGRQEGPRTGPVVEGPSVGKGFGESLATRDMPQVEPTPDRGVSPNTTLLFDRPLDMQVQESGMLSREKDASVQQSLDYTRDAFAETKIPALGRRKAAELARGADPEESEWVHLLRDKALEHPELAGVEKALGQLGKMTRTPLTGSGDKVAETGMTVPELRALLSDVRRRLRDPKRSRVEHLERLSQPMREEQGPARLNEMTDTVDRSPAGQKLQGQINTLDRLEEKQADLLRRGAISQPARTREASELLRTAGSVRAGTDLSDFSGKARKERILQGAGSFSERQRISGQARRIERARAAEGKAAPALKGLQQYQTDRIEMPFQYENIVDPDSITGVRPGVSQDPFTAAKEGQIRSTVISESEVKKLGLHEGKRVTIQSGDGRVIEAEIVGLPQAEVSDAAEVGLRMGLTPEDAATLIRNRWEGRSNPQVEVIFRPLDQTKSGLEDPSITGPAVESGRQSAREARAGITAAKPRLDIGFDPKAAEKLKAAGYGMDFLTLEKSKDLGAPWMLVKEHEDPAKSTARLFMDRESLEKMKRDNWAGNSRDRKEQMARWEAALVDPTKAKLITGADKIKKNTRFKTQAEVRAMPRDPWRERAGSVETGILGQLGIHEVESDISQLVSKLIDDFHKIPMRETGKRVEFSTKAEAEVQKWVDANPKRAQEMGHVTLPQQLRQRILGPDVPSEGPRVRSVSARPDDRRDLEFRPTSVGGPVSDPKEVMNILRGKGEIPKGISMLVEHWDENDRVGSRARFNAQQSDATLAIATDFSREGVDASVRAAKQKLVPVESFQDFLQGKDSAVAIATAKLNKIAGGTAAARKPIVLNVTGNDMKDLASKAKLTQAQLNEKLQVFIQKIASHPGRNFELKAIMSGGDTGIEEAAIIAARQLGIPDAAIMSNKFQIRDPVTGIKLWTDRALHERRFRGEDVSEDLAFLAAQAQQRFDAAKRKKGET